MRNSRVPKAGARIAGQRFRNLDRTFGDRVSEAWIAGFHPAGAHFLRSGCALPATPTGSGQCISGAWCANHDLDATELCAFAETPQ